MLSRLYGVLLPFFVSFLLAWLLDPLVGFIQHKCRVKFRGLSVAITLILFVGLLSLAVYLIIPAMGKEVKSAAVAVEQYFAHFDADKYFTPEQQEKIHSTLDGLNLESMLSYPEVRDAIKNLLPKVGGWITGGLSWLSELVVIFIGLMYLIFLMLAFPSIRANWRKYVPKKYYTQITTLVHEMSVNMNAYFRGQGLVALCVGILFAIGFTLIGMPMGFVMGLIIGVLNLVPYMQALGIPPCILLCLVQSAQTGQPVWLTLLLMAIVFIIVQTFQDMYLTPKIMGKVTGLGPAAILLSLSFWGALMGVIGMIIALPLTTLGLSCYKHYVLHEPFMSQQIEAVKPTAKPIKAPRPRKKKQDMTRKETIIAAILLIAFGTSMHFVHHVPFFNHFLGYIFPVTESVMAHMKMVFYPMLLLSLYLTISRRDIREIGAPVLGGVAVMPLIVLAFFSYWVFVRHELMMLDIVIYIACMIGATHLAKRWRTFPFVQNNWRLWIVLILCGIVIIGVLTYHSPDWIIFADLG